MIKLEYAYKKDTATCYRFENRQEDGNFQTLYLKKKQVEADGIDPKKGLTVTVEGRK